MSRLISIIHDCGYNTCTGSLNDIEDVSVQTRSIVSSRLREIEDSSVSLIGSIGFLLVLTPSTDHDSYRHTRRKTSQNSSRNSLRLVMVNSMHDSTYV